MEKVTTQIVKPIVIIPEKKKESKKESKNEEKDNKKQVILKEGNKCQVAQEYELLNKLNYII